MQKCCFTKNFFSLQKNLAVEISRRLHNFIEVYSPVKNYCDEEKQRRLSIVALHVNPLELLFRLFPFKIIS